MHELSQNQELLLFRGHRSFARTLGPFQCSIDFTAGTTKLPGHRRYRVPACQSRLLWYLPKLGPDIAVAGKGYILAFGQNCRPYDDGELPAFRVEQP